MRIRAEHDMYELHTYQTGTHTYQVRTWIPYVKDRTPTSRPRRGDHTYQITNRYISISRRPDQCPHIRSPETKVISIYQSGTHTHQGSEDDVLTHCTQELTCSQNTCDEILHSDTYCRWIGLTDLTWKFHMGKSDGETRLCQARSDLQRLMWYTTLLTK